VQDLKVRGMLYCTCAGFCERGNELYDQLKTVELLKGDSVLSTVCAKVLVLEGHPQSRY